MKKQQHVAVCCDVENAIMVLDNRIHHVINNIFIVFSFVAIIYLTEGKQKNSLRIMNHEHIICI